MKRGFDPRLYLVHRIARVRSLGVRANSLHPPTIEGNTVRLVGELNQPADGVAVVGDDAGVFSDSDRRTAHWGWMPARE